MPLLKCVIVDDEEIDRLMTTSFVKRFPQLELAGIFSEPNKALAFLEATNVDVLFLDIDMPGLSGLQLREKVKDVSVCIFITAHPEHAVESFDLDTLDFIVKPLNFERFEKAMRRIEEYMEVKTKASLFESSIGADTIYIKEGHNQIKVKLHEILYLEALKDYTLLVTDQKRHCVLSSIGTLLKEIHFKSFIRVHRSFAVQKHFVQKMTSNEIILNNKTVIPIGRSYKEDLNLIL